MPSFPFDSFSNCGGIKKPFGQNNIYSWPEEDFIINKRGSQRVKVNFARTRFFLILSSVPVVVRTNKVQRGREREDRVMSIRIMCYLRMRVRRTACLWLSSRPFSLSVRAIDFSLYPFRRPDRSDETIVRLETIDDARCGLDGARGYSPPNDNACTILGSALLPSRNSSRVNLSSWFLSI